ncbi:MAG TPA: hypothetical protein VGI17_05075 [Solirubrobacterales bacterium]
MAVTAIENPGDGKGAPLFHLLNGDLCYANLDVDNAPGVWRDFGNNVARSAANRPWMPALGNHECEFGVDTMSGQPGHAPGGVGAQGAAGNYWNGPYGYGHYLSRFLLPDNGVTNWDGNKLRGNFYSFQVGTVKFISLDADDVIYQDGASAYLNSAANAANEVTSSGASIPNGTVTYNHGYTGDLKIVAANNSAVPDFSTGTPNLQCIWLERTLREAREDPSVDMIVVFMHQCAMSTSVPGNGSDLGIRRAWLPLFDKYEVDLVLAGHNHNYLRSFPVRGYDPPSGWTTTSFTNPFGTYAAGDTIDTRRPTVTTTTPITHNGEEAWDTSKGTVHLIVGGGGASSTIGDTKDPATGLMEGQLWSDASGSMKAREDATWLALYDTDDAYGYAVFDVDPGDGPGETSITFQWFQMPSGVDGVTVLPPTTPLEKFVFTRLSGQMNAGVAAIHGTVSVGHTVTADPGDWSPSSATLSYRWLLDGTPIDGATGETYTLVAADEGRELKVQVTGEADGYETTTVTAAGAVVAGGTLRPAVVTVSGSAQVGGTVTANATPWTPPATLALQWLLNGSPIGGATGATYRPVASDAGHVLEVRVTGSAPGYQSASVTSAPLTVAAGASASAGAGVVAGRGAFSGARAAAPPKLSATPRVGVKVDANLAAGTPTAGLSYRWLLDGSPIKGARSASYTPVPADAGKQLQVQLTRPGESLVSKAMPVEAAAFRASRPGFRGTPAVGKTLSAITGRWSPSPSFEYQWLLDGRPIKGKTDPNLRLVGAYAGKAISLRVTARRTGYATRAETSDAVVIGKGSLKAPTPRIRGKARVGEALHVINGDWMPRPEFSYRWFVGGWPVDQGTGIAYKVRPQDRGKRIAVEVTGRAPGHKTVVKTSAATLPVRRG